MDESATPPTPESNDQDHETPKSLASISELLSGLIGGRGTHRGLDHVMVFVLDAEKAALAVAAHSPAISLSPGISKLVSLRPPRGPIATCALCAERVLIDLCADETRDDDYYLLSHLGFHVTLIPLIGRHGIHCSEELACSRVHCPAHERHDQHCWTIEGTVCRDGKPRFSEEKLEICLQCPAFGAAGVLAVGSSWHKAEAPAFTDAAMSRLSDHIGALIESHLTAKALARLNAELESRVGAARQEIIAKNELLLRSERLALLGKLAAGLAHEINNPLGVISTCVHSLILGNSSPKASKRSLEMILSEVQRISTLVRGLLDLSREQPLVLVETDVCGLVEQSLELVIPEAENGGVAVRFHRSTSPTHAHVDRSQLQQVVVNLALNAIQAIEDGGTLEVSVQSGSTRGESASLSIQFADNGPGMTTETIEKMFDPFFTTKQDSGGVGLGLSVSQSIIEKHGGTIVATSALGRGTVFTVTLPAEE